LVLSPETASPIFWVVDFSCWGWTAEATASALPLTKSPACSTNVFCESGLAEEASWCEFWPAGRLQATHLVPETLATDVRHVV
jgi:hypothetical protein